MNILAIKSLPLILIVALFTGEHCQADTVKNKTEKVKPTSGVVNEVDEYADAGKISDPLEPVNRATFWMNHQVYRYILKPVSRTYDAVVPSKVRTGVFNAFDNIEFPIRFVNNSLQLNFKRAGQEAEKFAVNTIGGVGGFVRLSDRIPSLVDVPRADTGQTFAKWGMGHGFYLILPILGPRSLRDTFGLAGDYALDPITWVSIVFYRYSWTLALSCPDTTRSLHDKLSSYESLTDNTVDRYLAVRTAYVQNRKQLKGRW